MTSLPIKTALALISAAALTFSLSACGDKKDSTDAPKINVGKENIPPPVGKQWSDMVAATPENGFVMGNPDAPAKLIEYGSYTCSHCRDFTEEASEPLRKMVDTGKLSYEFRSFLRDPYDLTMALLARCGGPEPFFPMTEQLFGYQNSFFEKAQAIDENTQKALMSQPAEKRFIALADATGLIDFAKQRGIPEDKAKQCLTDSKTADALLASTQKGGKDYEITGTPTFILNGSVVEDTATWSLLRTKLTEAGL